MESSPSAIVAPRKVARALLAAVGALVAMNILAFTVAGAIPVATIRMALERFLLDREQNVPTWFISTLLVGAAGLMLWIGQRQRAPDGRFATHWTALGVIFVLMSLDEAASFHELLILPLRERLGLGGVFYFSWVIVAIPICLVIGFTYLRFLINQPPRLRAGMIGAGAVYLSGALGVEMIGGVVAERAGQEGAAYFICTTVEESLEMVGIVLLISALLTHITTPVQRAPRPGLQPGRRAMAAGRRAAPQGEHIAARARQNGAAPPAHLVGNRGPRRDEDAHTIDSADSP